MTRTEILNAAHNCVCVDRNLQYGNPEDNFAKIAELWDVYIRSRLATGAFNLTSLDVANMMMLFKIARSMTANVQKADTFVDIAGYAACAGELSNGNPIKPFDVVLASESADNISEDKKN